MTPRSIYLTLAGRSVHCLDWGAENAPAVILWHGFARNAHDFENLGAALADRYRLIAPDTIGRGLSEWSPVPDTEYTVPFYARQATELLAQLKLEQVRWVGTSMGGLIGMVAAASALKGRISHLVLNDVGPAIASGAVERILSYAGSPPAFASLPELEEYFRNIYAPFGIASDEGWRRLAETSARRLHDGRLTPTTTRPLPLCWGGRRQGNPAMPGRSTTRSQQTPCCCVARYPTCWPGRPRRR